VLLHGLVQDGTLWRDVVADLRADHRCVVPTLPEGSHRDPVRADELLVAGARVPGGITVLTRVLGARPLRRLPVGLGALTLRPLPDDLADGWLHALRTDPAIRADLARYLRGSRKGEMLEAAEGLRRFDRPALVVWAADDLLMPGGHGPRLAAILPQGRLVEIAGSRTLVPVDQPARLAAELRAFVRDTPTGEPGADASVS
jgi:pimeloyl-ACP methyl ester carboxylesterase